MRRTKHQTLAALVGSVVLLSAGCSSGVVDKVKPEKSEAPAELSDELAGTCTYWVSEAQDNQEDSQLVKLDGSGESTTVELESSGSSSFEISIGQSVSTDGSKVLIATGSVEADAPLLEGWRLVSGDGETLSEYDWPGVNLALISPDGEHAAVSDNGGRAVDGPGGGYPDVTTFGIRSLDDGDELWSQTTDQKTLVIPVRWIDDQTLYTLTSGAGGELKGTLYDLDGEVVDEWPLEYDEPIIATPSTDLEHSIGFSGDNKLALYAKDNKEVETYDADPLWGSTWLDDKHFAFIKDGDLMQVNADDGTAEVVTEDFTDISPVDIFTASCG